MAIFLEKLAHFHAKNLGKIYDLLVGYRATASFDIGNDVAGHVTPHQLYFGGKLVLRPIFLMPKLDYVSSNEISFVKRAHYSRSRITRVEIDGEFPRQCHVITHHLPYSCTPNVECDKEFSAFIHAILWLQVFRPPSSRPSPHGEGETFAAALKVRAAGFAGRSSEKPEMSKSHSLSSGRGLG
jgi:hypothetical protein